MEQNAAPEGEPQEPAPARTPEEFVRRFLAELEALEEKRKQDAIAARLATLPAWIRRNPG